MISAMFDSSIAIVSVRRSFLMQITNLFSFARQIPTLLACLLLAACGDDSKSVATVATIEPGAPEFAGSQSCSSCHEDQYLAWQKSHHAQAMQPATAETVLGDFSGVDFEYFATTSRFFSRDNGFFVRTENAAGELQEFPIRYTFGVAPLQQYLIELPGGRLQPLTIAWDDRSADEGGQRWYHLYPDEFIDHDDELHWTGRAQNWNFMCAECHSTDLQKNYDLESDSFATTWSEINVGCEGCHGPASRHVQARQSGAQSGAGGLVTDLDDAGRAVWQMNPQTGIAERSEFRMRPPTQPEACGRCHSRRAQASPDYEYNKSLLDTHSPALLEEHLYFPDGQIRDEVYVYGSFLQSRMYQAGVSCSDCHDPHAATLRSAGEPSDICSTCHLPQKFAATEHHKHVPGSVACVDCHMPARTYMGVDDRRDHSFRIPRPDLTVSTGSPNACNSCHNDNDAEWATAAIQEWYGTERPAHYATALHAAQIGAIGANDLLIESIANEQFPGLARGTALTLLRGPYSQTVASSIQQSLTDPDPFVRTGALRALQSLQPELRAQWAGPLLADPVRSVRIEAVRIIAPVRSILHLQYGAAYREAEMELIDSLHAINERPEAHINLGNHYTTSGDATAAEAEFRTALRLDPQSAQSRVNLADLYRQLDRDEDAEGVIREGLEANPDDAALRHSLGLLLVRGAQQDQALAELETAAMLQPDNARFVYVYGIGLNSLGQTDTAIEVLTQAAIRFEADFDIHWALITILRDQGHVEEARLLGVGMAARYPENESVQELVRAL
ncbi:MAG: Tfp pilus assembly protein PilF [Woeseiaceae bacterium]|jgi:Tfp pilus assembly protein PilF